MMRLRGTDIGNIVTSDVVADKHVSKRGWQWGTALQNGRLYLKEKGRLSIPSTFGKMTSASARQPREILMHN